MWEGIWRRGCAVETLEAFEAAAVEGKNAVRQGKPYIINAIIGKTEFRKAQFLCNGEHKRGPPSLASARQGRE